MIYSAKNPKRTTQSVPFRRHFDILLTSVFVVTTLDGLTLFFSRQQCKKCMETVCGISLRNGGKLEESEGYNYFFTAFCVLQSK